MKYNAALLISVLRSAVTNSPISVPSTADWNLVLSISRSHKVTGLLLDGLKKGKTLNLIPADVCDTLQQEYRKTVVRSIQMEEQRKQIAESLREAGIDFVFLKGSVLKDFYPVPELRTMSDIDLLVKADDAAEIGRIFAALGAQAQGGDGNHYNFRFPQNLCVECHPNLVHPTAPFGTGLNPGWQYCKRGEDGQWAMTANGLYLHTLCHLAEHFLSGGVGVRFVLDLWLLRRNKAGELNFALLDNELERMDLKEFEANIAALGDMWFGGAETDKDLSELEEYILTSGVFGFSSRGALNALSLSGDKRSATMKHVLYSREELENRYPWSRRSVLLLPAAWIARAFFVLTKRGGQLKAWFRNTNNVSSKDIAAQREKLARFGIYPKA